MACVGSGCVNVPPRAYVPEYLKFPTADCPSATQLDLQARAACPNATVEGACRYVLPLLFDGQPKQKTCSEWCKAKNMGACSGGFQSHDHSCSQEGDNVGCDVKGSNEGWICECKKPAHPLPPPTNPPIPDYTTPTEWNSTASWRLRECERCRCEETPSVVMVRSLQVKN